VNQLNLQDVSHALKIVSADEQIQKSGGVAKILLQGGG